MKIIIIGIACFIVFSGCSGYLGQDESKINSGTADHLALSDGSGYLSSD